MLAQTSFNDILETIDLLSKEQQQTLIDIIQKRLLTQKCEMLLSNIEIAKQEFAFGNVRSGSVDDLLKELET
jgi:hypothetical protein